MTFSDEDRNVLIKLYIEKCRQASDDAEFLIENDKLFVAANRIYYAIFYILSALALKHKFSTKKHHQLIGWFNKNFVKTNIVDEKYKDIIRNSFDIRSDADYDVKLSFTREEIESAFKEMKEVISVIKKLL